MDSLEFFHLPLSISYFFFFYKESGVKKIQTYSLIYCQIFFCMLLYTVLYKDTVVDCVTVFIP